MQPTGAGKEHQPPSSPTSLSPQPLHQPPSPSGTCCDCKTSGEGRKPRLCCSHSARMHLAKRRRRHRAQGGGVGTAKSPRPLHPLSSNTRVQPLPRPRSPSVEGLAQGRAGTPGEAGAGWALSCCQVPGTARGHWGGHGSSWSHIRAAPPEQPGACSAALEGNALTPMCCTLGFASLLFLFDFSGPVSFFRLFLL